MKQVKTFDGTIHKRSECRYISGQFYKMHSQCIKMPDSKWHRINNGLILQDYRTRTWHFRKDVKLINGIVDIKDDGTYVYGYFSKDPLKEVYLSINNDGFTNTVIVIDEKLVNNKNFVEELSTGTFYNIKDINTLTSKARLNNKVINSKYSFRLFYNFEHLFPEFKIIYDNEFKFKPSKNKFYKELNDITFGVEFETYNGIIPERHVRKSGLIPLRDGSLRHGGTSPFEYTTIPLQGEKGIHALSRHCELLNKYCTNSVNSSLHIHVGGIKLTKEYVLTLFKTLKLVESEIYSIFPKYYKNTSKFKSSGKDYCNTLPNIKLTNDVDKDLENLFMYYSNNTLDELFDNDRDDEDEIDTTEIHNYYIGMPHPYDSTFDRKWNQSMRYKWVNFIPLLFNNRGTIEFRIHPPTFNIDKVLNWLFIVVGICKFADEYQKDNNFKINKLTLEEILSLVYSKDISDHLSKYIKYRKEMVIKDSINDDNYGKRELSCDDVNDFSSKKSFLL